MPPDDPGDADMLAVPWKTEFDVVSTLRELGHEVRPLGVRSDLGVVREAIEEWQPHIAFNLLEEFDGVATYDQNVVAYLELLRVPYTGCNPRGLMLSRDKALSKKILAYHRIPCPDFAVFPLGRAVRRPRRLSFPLIVKSLTEDASLGISQASVVENDEKLRERVTFIHESLGTSAIVERYIEGRELYVSVVGNRRLSVFPVWELRMEGLPDEARPDRDPAPEVEPPVPEEVRDPVGRGARPARSGRAAGSRTSPSASTARSASAATRASTSAWTRSQGTYALEANPNPEIAYGEELAESAEKAGLSYEGLLQQILSLGLHWRHDVYA